MPNCDDIFQQIQALEGKKQGLNEASAQLSADVEEPDPVGRFVFRGKDGQNYEASFDEIWKQVSQDPLATRALAEIAAEGRVKPNGAEGQFENFAQLVDRMGLDSAADLGALLFRFTGDWEKANPSDFSRVIAQQDPETFKARLAAAFGEAGVAINEDRLAQMVSRNVAPFLGVLDNQNRLRTLEIITRNNVIKKVEALRDQIAETGVAPTREAKVAFMKDYYTAIYSHRSARIASRRSGQLLQNYQRLIDEDSGATDSLFRTTGAEAKAEADKVAQELIAMTPEELVQEGSFAKAVIEAADRGAAGKEDLEQLILTGKTEGIDPADDGLDKGWEKTWRRNARAAYKDSILFSPRTQLLMNYVSQKVVFAAEGYKRLTGLNAWKLYGARQKARQLAFFDGQPELLEKAAGQPTYINPLATDFFRESMKAQLDGARIAWAAGTKANDVIRQTWGESLQKHFMDGDTPFAGNVDSFQDSGQMSIKDQYRMAQEVWDEPLSRDRFLFQLRDKLHLSLKVLANRKIEAATGKKLPVMSALQLMTAVDQRAGLKVFMTARANDLMLEQAAKFPDGNLKQWTDAVDTELREQIYQADPSPTQIEAARSQFGLEEPGVGPDGEVAGLTDDEVAAFIASEKLGYPVLTTIEQYQAKDLSIALRMQQRQTEGIPGAIDQAVSGLRRSEVGDVMVSFWRSPFNQQLWDLSLAGSPFSAVYKTAQVSGKLVQGKLTPELLAETQSSLVVATTMLGMFMALKSQGVITGNGPVDPNTRKQWTERLNAEGKVANSVFGIPFNMGGVPVLNSLFLMADMADVVDQGGVSDFDQQFAFEGALQLVAGQIMRTPGFRQVQMLYDALANGSSNAWEKLARFGAFMANGQMNPASGVERLAEWGTGSQWQDLMPPQPQSSAEERYAMEQLPDDHPLKKLESSLRSWTYMSNPGLAHWAGLRLKETTWLGRSLRRPDGIFRGEWPIGVPGVWEFNNGEYRVEQGLEGLGLLNPPRQLMLGKDSHGVQMTPAAMEEYNSYLGTVTPSMRYSDDPKHGGAAVWRGAQTTVIDGGEVVPAGRVTLDMTDMVDQAVQGRTVREALDYAMQSRQYKRWDADPEFTTNPKVRDMTKEMRRNQPGPTLLKTIKDYYAALAEDKLDASNSEAAQQLRADREALRRDGSGLEGSQMRLLEMSR